MKTNCCNSNFTEPGWPDSDVCSQCGEHCEPELTTKQEDLILEQPKDYPIIDRYLTEEEKIKLKEIK